MRLNIRRHFRTLAQPSAFRLLIHANQGYGVQRRTSDPPFGRRTSRGQGQDAFEPIVFAATLALIPVLVIEADAESDG